RDPMSLKRPKMLSPRQRAAAYTFRWPDRPPLQAVDARIYGVWLIGPLYKGATRLYGSYPVGFVERLTTVFPETPRLHLFAGGVCDPEGVTFDIRPESKPNVIGDVMHIADHFPAGHFAVVLADPPYNAKARDVYGTAAFCKRRALREVHKVIRRGGVLAWLDTSTPIWSHEHWEWGGLIGVQVGSCRVFRALSILIKRK
ncbi:MAG: hypothetical protein KAX19_12650, partial [Candidatus Brocadiae bacterium]|nr:hypothetical protein [Candidatus Brocadiia bacterium]